MFGEKMNIKEKLENYRRVLQIARKPSYEEFISSAKICAIGILIIGLVGFVVYLVANYEEIIKLLVGG
jgi:protein transport protein SEC61 subunit gamma-like protein